jgi:D-aminopeptidase
MMNSESRRSSRRPKAEPMRLALWLLLAMATAIPSVAQNRPRGRDLGIPFPGQTGPLNSITDVAGVAVGHVTLIEGEGKLVPGKGPIRTGVTAILPRPRGNWDPVFAATFNQNGNGDMTGINWIKESGFLEGPILLTGTHSVGTVRDAAIQWQLKNGREFIFTYPIVAETFDFLNDANGEHVKAAHAFEALDRAKPGRVEEGAVGGVRGWAATDSKAASAHPRVYLQRRKVGTPSACWCNATTAATCESLGFRFVPRSLTFEPAQYCRHR